MKQIVSAEFKDILNAPTVAEPPVEEGDTLPLPAETAAEKPVTLTVTKADGVFMLHSAGFRSSGLIHLDAGEVVTSLEPGYATMLDSHLWIHVSSSQGRGWVPVGPVDGSEAWLS